MPDAKTAISKLKRDRFTALPPLNVWSVEQKGGTDEVPNLKTLTPARVVAKAGDTGVFPFAYGTVVYFGKVIRSEESGGSLVEVTAPETITHIQPKGKKGLTVTSIKTEVPVQVLLYPPIKGNKPVPLEGLWRAAGTTKVDGKPVAVFHRIEVKAEDAPKK